MRKKYYVYILTNRNSTVLYTGVTCNIWRRLFQHKAGKGGKFTSKYNVTKLVFVEVTDSIAAAIAREKQIKAGSRQKKIDLINTMNPAWTDLLDKDEQ